jgi:hypothetical protein
MISKKTSETTLLQSLIEGKTVLDCLRIASFRQTSRTSPIDAQIELELIADESRFPFDVEAKSDNSPRTLNSAIVQIQKFAGQNNNPLVIVPYLSSERLQTLEDAQVSGIDLCGNGLIIIPGRLYVRKAGLPNQYPDSRPLNNPYRGRSAMVARMLLERPQWGSLNKLAAAIVGAGTKLSLSQTSKAVQALADDDLVTKFAGEIALREPQKLMDRLGTEWTSTTTGQRRSFRSPGRKWAEDFSNESQLRWATTGESSSGRYAALSQSGPRQVAVSDLMLAESLLRGKPEPIPNFADIELIETEESGYFFQNEVDNQGMRWASRLQTWLELQAGDGRQQEAATTIRQQILSEAQL